MPHGVNHPLRAPRAVEVEAALLRQRVEPEGLGELVAATSTTLQHQVGRLVRLARRRPGVRSRNPTVGVRNAQLEGIGVDRWFALKLTHRLGHSWRFKHHPHQVQALARVHFQAQYKAGWINGQRGENNSNALGVSDERIHSDVATHPRASRAVPIVGTWPVRAG